MKKILKHFTIFLLLFAVLALPVSAKTAEVLDVAALLSPDEETDLAQRLATFESSYGLTVVLLTVPDLMGQPIVEFADNYYDNNRYSEDGLLFLLDMGSRQWYISTSGRAIELLSDVDLMDIEDAVIPYFSEGRFYDGFSRFLDILPGYLSMEEESGGIFGTAILTGAVIAVIVLLILRGSMNTKRSQSSAASYEVEGSYNLRRHQDLFLYSKVSKREKPKQNTGSGSSTHRSSSGRSHGGRGGRF